jgi:hypothetical protein
VLDPLPQPGGAPHVLRPLERVERGLVRGVADRCTPTGQPASAPSRTISSSSSPVVITTPEPSLILAVCEPSVPSMNSLSSRAGGGESRPAPQADLAQLRESVGRRRLPDAVRAATLRLEPLPEPIAPSSRPCRGGM